MFKYIKIIIFSLNIILFSSLALAETFTYQNLDATGNPTTVEIKVPPKRVITTNGSATETLLRLGLQDLMIGSSWQDNPVAPDLAKAYESVPVISEHYPSRELVLGLEPDFIYGWGSAFNPQALGDVTYWHELGVGTFINRNSILTPQRIANFYQDIEELGKIFKVEDRVEDFLSKVKTDIAAINKKVSAVDKRREVIIGEYLPNGIFLAYGKSSLADEILTLAGGSNLLPEGAILSPEGLIVTDPEIIIMIHMLKTEAEVESHLDEIRKNSVLGNLKAVKQGQVYPLPMAEAHCAGVRIPDGVLRLATYLYPELF
jgi:iron complex transport system substrate-binding protein